MQANLFLVLRLIMIITQITFVGFVISALWRERKRRLAVLQTETHPILILVQPPDGRSMRYRSLEVVIGRSQGCDAVIPDPTLSGKHARFSYHHQHWWLEDLQTTNGTLLNGQMITTPVVITDGDSIQCGRVRLEVILEEPA